MPLYSLFVSTEATRARGSITFRVGLPTTLANAHKRHERFDLPSYHDGRRFGVAGYGESLIPIRWYEVRECDANGQGIGSERHGRAIPCAVGDIRPMPEGEHTLYMYGAGRYWSCTLAAPGDGSRHTLTACGTHPMIAQAAARRNARKSGLI